MVNKTTYDPKYCEMLLEDAEQGLSFEAFAGRIRVTRPTLYNWAKKHEDFAFAKDIAAEISRRFWETKGIVGMHMGKEFNATTWIFNMKNRFGWKDRHDHKIDADLNLKNIPDNELKSLTVEALKFLRGDSKHEANLPELPTGE